MHPRAQHLIDSLALQHHPEGGWYRPMYKSAELVTRQRDHATRSACTTIVFLLVAGTSSEWHRVLSDEVWHFYEGDALELSTRDEVIVLDADNRVHVVPAGAWQSARPLGEYALVGCTVAPGFEWDDFALETDGTPASPPAGAAPSRRP